MKTHFIILFFIFSFTLAAPEIFQMEIGELAEQTEVIVIAKVIKVDSLALDDRKPIPYDEIIIQTRSIIKGEIKEPNLKLVLQSRGVKGFDPELKTGDFGVFSLKDIKDGTAKLAYWGSIAVFEKQNFQ